MTAQGVFAGPLGFFYNGAKTIVTAYREEKLNNYCKHKQKGVLFATRQISF